MTAAAEATLPLATVHGLFHIAIKTDNLAATRRFWTDIIGLKEFPRPDFGYPGAWLGSTQPGGLAIIHVYAGGPAPGPEGKAPAGAPAVRPFFPPSFGLFSLRFPVPAARAHSAR